MKIKPSTVKQLRDIGFKIYVSHFRRVQIKGNRIENINGHPVSVNWVERPMKEIREECLQPHLLPIGGKSVVKLVSPQGKEVTFTQPCYFKDHFRGTLATKIALGRAAKEMCTLLGVKSLFDKPPQPPPNIVPLSQ